jgi:hypothetical protein
LIEKYVMRQLHFENSLPLITIIFKIKSEYTINFDDKRILSFILNM